MGNAAGALAVLAAIAKPGLIVPHVQVEDLSSLDWDALKEAGVRHIVIDKDNCITLPLDDDVCPDLIPAWERMKAARFDSVLVVSNSAGSSDDPLAIGAEHLARKLQQRVLAHPAKKPAMACARQVIDVIEGEERGPVASTSLSSDVQRSPAHIAVIGDRITTDIVLASRVRKIARKRHGGTLMAALVRRLRAAQASASASTSSSAAAAPQVIGILTTRILSPERLGTRLMRGIEMWVLARLVSFGITPGGSWLSGQRRNVDPSEQIDWQGIASLHAQPEPSSTMQVMDQESETVDAAEAASKEAHAQLPITARMRMLPSLALQRIGGASLQAGLWLGQGWCLIQDGIRLGTKGSIGAPDANRMRQSRLLGVSGNPADSTAMHLRDGWPSTSQMFAKSHRLDPAAAARPWQGQLAAENLRSSIQTRGFRTSVHVRAAPGRTGSGTPRPPPGWKPNYAAAIAALILMPTGWYAGTLLHDYFHPDAVPDAAEVAQEAERLQQHDAGMPGDNAPATAGVSSRTDALSKRGAGSAAQSLSDLFTGKPSVQSLYTKRINIERELERTEEKLVEIRARIATRDAAEGGEGGAGPTTTEFEARPRPMREPVARSKLV